VSATLEDPETPRRRGVPVTVEAVANAPVEAAFDAIVPIDLAKMFTGYGPLPAVSGTRDQSGDWDHVGATRTVELSDGSTAAEVILAYERPSYFAYRVSGFTSSLRLLANGARGEWWFAPAGEGAAEIRWRYTFEPRGLSRPLLSLVVSRLWRGYARRALALAVEEAGRSGRPERPLSPRREAPRSSPDR
jgi:hypothetical protein